MSRSTNKRRLIETDSDDDIFMNEINYRDDYSSDDDGNDHDLEEVDDDEQDDDEYNEDNAEEYDDETTEHDETEADETEADETEADETEADESEADETEYDEYDTEETEADGNDDDTSDFDDTTDGEASDVPRRSRNRAPRAALRSKKRVPAKPTDIRRGRSRKRPRYATESEDTSEDDRSHQKNRPRSKNNFDTIS